MFPSFNRFPQQQQHFGYYQGFAPQFHPQQQQHQQWESNNYSGLQHGWDISDLHPDHVDQFHFQNFQGPQQGFGFDDMHEQDFGDFQGGSPNFGFGGGQQRQRGGNGGNGGGGRGGRGGRGGLRRGRFGLNQSFFANVGDFPKTDIYEDNNNCYVVLELPGWNKETLDLDIRGYEGSKQIVIVGKVHEGQQGQGQGQGQGQQQGNNITYINREINSQKGFTRSITVPNYALTDRIEAKLEAGLLRITIPKAQNPINEGNKKKILIHETPGQAPQQISSIAPSGGRFNVPGSTVTQNNPITGGGGYQGGGQQGNQQQQGQQQFQRV